MSSPLARLRLILLVVELESCAVVELVRDALLASGSFYMSSVASLMSIPRSHSTIQKLSNSTTTTASLVVNSIII